MTVSELTAEQMEKLKQNYLTQHLLEVEDREPSYDELANAAELVPDWIIVDAYGGIEFSNDDFFCSCSTPDNLENIHAF